MKSYRPDGETLGRFGSSKAHVKVIQGPIGSGKSLACCMCVWSKALEQVPQKDGKRRGRAHVFRDCYDDKTEILTERRGWVLFKDLQPDDKVAQLNGDSLEFVQPTAYIAKPYVGEMVGFESEGVDFLVTPNHRLWASAHFGRSRSWLPYKFMIAEDAYGGDIRVRRDAQWEGAPTRHSEDVFEWLGFWFAEGSGGIYRGRDGYSRRKLTITQVKPGGVAYARALFARAGIPFTENKRSEGVNFRVAVCADNAWLFTTLCGLGGAREKGMPVWMKAAPEGHLRAFIKGYLVGDGWVSHGSVMAATSSRALADDLQEIALKAGMVANMNERKAVVSKVANDRGIIANGGQWRLTFVNQSRYRPRLNETYKTKTAYRRWYRQHYAGNIYCVEVPTHIVYVRRNGKAIWCGQTYSRIEETTLKTWLEWFPEEEFGRFYWSKPFLHEIRVGDIEFDVTFMALEDERAVSYFRSLETTMCWFNEVQYMDRVLFDEAVSRVGRYPRKIDGGPINPQVIADMNAPDETHWVPIMRGEVAAPDWFTDEQRRAHVKPPGWEFYTQPAGLIEVKGEGGDVVRYEPNPKAENVRYLPDNYYANVSAGKTKSWIDANVLNRVSPRRDGKPVLPDFNRAVHVAKEPLKPIPGSPLIIGLDFARKPAAIIMQNLRERWYVLDELVGRDMGSSKFAPLLRNMLAQKYPGIPFQMWGDPSGDFKGQNDEQTPFMIFRTYRMQVRPAPSILFSVRLQAAEAVLTRMREGKPAMLVSPTCTTLIAALDGGYHYRRLKTSGERYEEKPDKQDIYSDPADAWMYALLGGGEGKMLLTGSSEPKTTTNTKRPYNPFGKKQGGLSKW